MTAPLDGDPLREIRSQLVALVHEGATALVEHREHGCDCVSVGRVVRVDATTLVLQSAERDFFIPLRRVTAVTPFEPRKGGT